MQIISSGPFAGLVQNGYKVIYADPAWTFSTRSSAGKGRSPEQHYDCMSLDEIKKLPVYDLAAPDCVLLMWVIDTHLEMALDVMREWGFKYKTKGFNWVKLNADGSPFTGMGFWTRANPEDCLLGTKGQPKRAARDVRRLIMSPRREHSRKPDEVREAIERLVPGPYVELFARSTKHGWDSWGNQTTRFDLNVIGANTPLLDAQSEHKENCSKSADSGLIDESRLIRDEPTKRSSTDLSALLF